MVIDSDHNGGLELYIAKTNVRGVRTCSIALSFLSNTKRASVHCNANGLGLARPCLASSINLIFYFC